MDEVSLAELLECARAGRTLDGGNGADDPERRLVPPELLRRLCRDLRDEVDPRGIRLSGVAVPAELDLAGLDIPFPLRFDSCAFDTPLRVEGAQLSELAVTGSTLPGLLANGVRLHRDLDLSYTQISGTHATTASQTREAAVWLCESQIGGRLLCSGTVIRAVGERAVQADLMQVGGAVRFLDQFTAYGEVRLIGVRLGGSLDLVEANIRVAGGHGLDLTNAVIGGSVFIIDSSIQGRVELSSTRISGQLQLRGSTLSASAGPGRFAYSHFRDADAAISAPRLTVGAEVTLEDGCAVTGGINLSMATLSSLLIESGCSLRAPGRTALDLTNAEIQSTVSIGEEVPVEGTVRLTGAAVHGDLRLDRARLSAPADQTLIAAEGARIDGQVRLEELRADGGQLSFRAAVIGSAVEAGGARLHNPGGHTLSLVQASVRGTVRLTNGFQSTGKVVLNRAVVQGRLLCTGGTFSCPGPSQNNRRGHAIEAISANLSGGMDLGWQSASPSADFTDTRTSFLADDPGRWPAHFMISGFSYERLEQPQGLPAARIWDHPARCAWLRRQDAYDAGPYEQAARVFRQHGYADGATAILIAQRRHARSGLTGRAVQPRRALDRAFSLTVGYGFRPARVLWLIAALLILVTVTLRVPAAQATMRATTSAGAVYTTAGPLQPGAGGPPRADACGGGQVRCFNPVFYAIDTVIPLISLDQRDTWYPDPSAGDGGVLMEWWLNLATILGWLLSSVFVLALASFARST